MAQTDADFKEVGNDDADQRDQPHHRKPLHWHQPRIEGKQRAVGEIEHHLRRVRPKGLQKVPPVQPLNDAAHQQNAGRGDGGDRKDGEALGQKGEHRQKDDRQRDAKSVDDEVDVQLRHKDHQRRRQQPQLQPVVGFFPYLFHRIFLLFTLTHFFFFSLTQNSPSVNLPFLCCKEKSLPKRKGRSKRKDFFADGQFLLHKWGAYAPPHSPHREGAPPLHPG